jgi:DNA-binding NtrC family response regulator/iron only hydrogenase large subunit-like protein
MGLIQTDLQRCRNCYACVRHCPVKAIRVTPQGTDLNPGCCIGCGRCLLVCSQQARFAPGARQRSRRLLKHKEPMAAILAPSFPAYLGDMRPGQMVAGLRKLGFQIIVEGAWGVELLADRLSAEASETLRKPMILGHCPAVVALIERQFPQLLRNLSPLVSPLVATARAVRSAYGGPLRIVTISSCFAGKLETADDSLLDTVDAALTFAEAAELLEEAGIDPLRLPDSCFDGPEPGVGRLFPLAGGALATLMPTFSGAPGEVLSVEGARNALEIFRDLAAGRITPAVLDLRLCRGGCLGPCDPASRLSPFARGHMVQQFARQTETCRPNSGRLTGGSAVPLERAFSNRQSRQEHPSGESIRRVLHSTDKFTQRDELDCGACSYTSCREHATAVCRNQAKEDMCLPYFVKRLKAEKQRLEQAMQLARHASAEDLIEEGGLMRRLRDLAKDLAPGDKTLLLRGEAGTGKETLARTIHRLSRRADQPMATINCTGLDDRQLMTELFGCRQGAKPRQGLLELASGSTLLLDEIADAGPQVQRALLDFLDRGTIVPAGLQTQVPVDVRLIVTSHRDLEQGVRDGWFNDDLFFRLSFCTLTLPPLRNRPEALPELALQQLQRASRRLNKRMTSIDPLAMDTLRHHDWPGNIPELASVIERAVAVSQDNILRQEHLCLPLVGGPPGAPMTPAEANNDFRARRGHQMELIERDLLERYLLEATGNVSAAARRANLPRRTFYRLMERYGIQRRQFSNRPRSGE